MTVDEKWLEEILNRMAAEVRRHAMEGCQVCLKIANDWKDKAEGKEVEQQ